MHYRTTQTWVWHSLTPNPEDVDGSGMEFPLTIVSSSTSLDAQSLVNQNKLIPVKHKTLHIICFIDADTSFVILVKYIYKSLLQNIGSFQSLSIFFIFFKNNIEEPIWDSGAQNEQGFFVILL